MKKENKEIEELKKKKHTIEEAYDFSDLANTSSEEHNWYLEEDVNEFIEKTKAQIEKLEENVKIYKNRLEEVKKQDDLIIKNLKSKKVICGVCKKKEATNFECDDCYLKGLEREYKQQREKMFDDLRENIAIRMLKRFGMAGGTSVMKIVDEEIKKLKGGK